VGRTWLKIWNGLIHLQKIFMVIAGVVITILVFIEVLLRYVLGSPLFGVEELICLIAMWLYFIGASYGAYERSHIKAELIHIWFKKPRSYALVRTVSSLITFVLSIIMIIWTYPYFVWGIIKGETSQALLLPMVLSQSAIFVSAILMSLYFFVELMDYLFQSLGKTAIFEQLSNKEI
jgi:TRAP-type C4-dicarboxylate transport system permease small subunit